MNILLTGGAGYIGSHTAVVISQAGHEVVLLDNFCNGQKSVLERLQKILGKAVPCVEGDVRDTALVAKTWQDYKIDAVIHFAGLKAVGESVANPVLYYANNVQGSISLLQAMQKIGVKTLVFSSSATVYGEPQYLPYDEDHPTRPMNPYGQSKLQVEEIVRDLAASGPEWKIVSLRYFNPVGAHESGRIGEDPNGITNNLMPYVAKVNSGERDYIHVMDLAEGNMAALEFLKSKTGLELINLGTGRPSSVFDLVSTFKKVTGLKIKKAMVGRRAGDLPIYYAKSAKANQLLKWEATRSLDQICSSTRRYLRCKDVDVAAAGEKKIP